MKIKKSDFYRLMNEVIDEKYRIIEAEEPQTGSGDDDDDDDYYGREDCSDGFDNDGDGRVDCDDSDCSNVRHCKGPGPVTESFNRSRSGNKLHLVSAKHIRTLIRESFNSLNWD